MPDDVLDRERARDAVLQTQLDNSSVYPYARPFCIPRVDELPTLEGFEAREDLAETSGFTEQWAAAPDAVETRVRGAYTDTHVWFGFVCAEPRIGEMRVLDHRPPIYRDDHVGVYIDTAHNHRSLVAFTANALAVKEGEKGAVGRGNRYWERKRHLSNAIMEWDARAAVGDAKWTATLAIPFETLGLAGPPERGVWGVNFVRHRFPDYSGTSLWNPTWRAGVAPWAFGDLYFGDPPVVLERIGLGELRGDGGEATVWLRNRAEKGRTATVVIDTFADHGLTHFDHAEAECDTSSGEGGHATLPYRLDTDSWADSRVRVRVLDENAEALHEGWYLFGYENGQKLMVRFAREEAPNPKPGDKDFMDKKRRHIINRLPAFERATTAQGAPSDFVIRAKDGSVEFNLMQPGALARIAAHIHSLFDNDTDRLLGANYFVHQPAGMVYSNHETSLVAQLSPLSLLRFGSAQCCCHASALVGIVRRMEIGDTGRFFRAERLELEGHVIAVAEHDGRMALLDPSVGRFFYLWDDKTLASANDIAADLSLADRAGKGLRRYFEGAARFHYYGVGAGVWPPGAPAE